MLCNPISNFPSQIDDLTFFQDINLDNVQIMETYENLIKEEKYNEANEYINQQENVFGYFDCFFNMIENRIYSVQHYLLNRGKKHCPFITTGKNLFHNTFTTQEINGITFTVNDDGSVTLNGTATAQSIITTTVTLLSGRYILNGCNNGNSDLSTYYLCCKLNDDDKVVSYNGDSETFSIINDIELNVQIVVNDGVTVNNVNIYPMIRYTAILDKTYEKYVVNDGDISF